MWEKKKDLEILEELEHYDLEDVSGVNYNFLSMTVFSTLSS